MIDLHQSMDSNTWQSNSYAEKKTLRLKGQMNPKIDIFSVVALPSPNTKKKHPKWDLGKDFSSQAFIERWKIKIPAFPKTSRKRFWNGRVIDWRLWRQCWSFSAEKRSAQASAHPLSPAFVCLVLLEFWQRLNEIHEVSTFPPCKGFFFVCFSRCCCFFVTWKLLWIQNNQC